MESTAPQTRSAEPALSPRLEPPDPVTPAAPASQGKRRPKPFLILGALVLAGALGLGIHTLLNAGLEETDDAEVEADVVPVGPRVGGQVLSVEVTENQVVRRGELILQLDPADFESHLAQAEADLSTAQAQAAASEAEEQVAGANATGALASAEAGLSSSARTETNSETAVAAAQAGLERARADARKAELDLDRARRLRDDNAASQEFLDHSEAAASSARAALQQAEAQLAGAQSAREAAGARVAEARGHLQQSSPVGARLAAAHALAELSRARVRSAEASLKLARLFVEYTKVVAPEDGVVSKLGVQPGQNVQAGQAAAELVPARTYLVANFKETQIGDMRPGQKAEIRIDAYPGRVFEGTVESRSGGTGARFALVPPDNASGNFVKVVQRVPVRIAWTSPPDVPLAAGLSALVTVRVR